MSFKLWWIAKYSSRSQFSRLINAIIEKRKPDENRDETDYRSVKKGQKFNQSYIVILYYNFIIYYCWLVAEIIRF